MPTLSRPDELIILIPYRDRASNLARLIPALKRHLADRHPGLRHSIHVLEQAGSSHFNKGRLLNAGFTLLKKRHGYFCFHDVDLLPISTTCDYSRPVRPTHLSFYCSQSQFLGSYDGHTGGVLLINSEDFIRANGFSNEYWGWGAEDDDLGRRLVKTGAGVQQARGRYLSLPHKRPPGKFDRKSPTYSRNKARYEKGYDHSRDGLSTLSFREVSRQRTDTHIHYFLDVGCPPQDLRPAPRTKLGGLPRTPRRTCVRTRWKD